ncbi:ATP-binding protein [Legionella dresdenensis]|uniref:histidine kinase n=1 Tax=Legionella dresdenensis TaxID=450200 RepID=A0ABV8CE21_9GAMM
MKQKKALPPLEAISTSPDIRHLNVQAQDRLIADIIYYYETIIGCMPGNVYWLDREGKTVGCNQNVLDMFGMQSIAEFRGLNFEEMGKIGNWSEEAIQSFKTDSLAVMESGIAKLNIEEPPIPHQDGRVIYFLTHRVPILDQQKQVTGLVGISIDITERKQMENALREALQKAEDANHAKSEFLENMRHDIRTPLTGITGLTEIIRDEIKDPALQTHLDALSESSQALLDLLNEILELVKLSSGESAITVTKFNLENRLKSIIELNRAKAAEKQLALNFDYDPALGKFLIGDDRRIHRLTLELITNAIVFTATGHVTLSATLAKQTNRDIVLKLAVSDTGIGIPAEKQEVIFQRFKRLTPSYKGTYQGAGLGLSIVKQFIDELDGELYINSEVNHGTTFTCLIPLKKPLLDTDEGAKADLPMPAPAAQKPLVKTSELIDEIKLVSHDDTYQVLLVEDNTIAAIAAKAVLVKNHCAVTLAVTGEEALALARTNPNFDLILMDIGLPDSSGDEIAIQIRRDTAHKTTPIIALTAHVGEENTERYHNAGMNMVLSKPFNQNKADTLIAAYLTIKKSTAQTATTIIDEEFALKQLQGDKHLLQDMFSLFLSTLPEERQLISNAYMAKDWTLVKALVHKMKSSASYCGAQSLVDACKNMEAAIKNNETEIYETCYQAFENELNQATQAITTLVQQKISNL